MKKILLHFLFFIFLCFPLQGFWAECWNSCSLDNGPSQVLREYISNTRILLRNISTQVQDDPQWGAIESNREFIRVYNAYVFNWDSYFDGFEYSLLLPLHSEIPSQIRRDYKLIEQSIDYQNTYLRRLTRQWKTKADIGDICGEITNCKLSNLSGEAAAQILANTHKLAHVYRMSLLWKKQQVIDIDILFWEKIASNIISSYNPNISQSCSACKEGFFDRISTAITNIVANNKGFNAGIQEWKNAWALLNGDPVQVKAFEAKNQTNKQPNILLNKKEISLQALDKYNWGSPFLNNATFIENASDIQNSLSSGLDSFKEAVLGAQDNEDNEVSIIELESSGTNVDKTSEIYTIISVLHEANKSLGSSQDISSQTGLASTYQMHQTLTTILTKNLNNKTVENSQDACNGQHRWEWNCE